MKNLKLPSFLALAFAFSVWAYFLFSVPTFDFDEALYRRVAESMKAAHNPWLLKWDGDSLFHKPPIFYWLICFFSDWVDGAEAGVSALASRLPSLFSSLGILASLYFGFSYVVGEKVRTRANWIPVLAFLIGAFPLLTSASVVFDPLQTFFLMPSLLIPARFFFNEEPIRKTEWALWTMSLFWACAAKGLNGIIVPSLALALHLLLQIKNWGFWAVVKTGVKYLAFAFVPASILIAAFYALLDYKIGRAFTHEFLWVQHFERSQNVMEAHSGSLLYHPLVLFFGGGFLTPLLFYTARRNKKNFKKYGFPLTYAFSFVLVFSFSATKLPHYTWPVWPALALFLGLITFERGHEQVAHATIDTNLDRRLGFVASIPVLFLGVALLLFATGPEMLMQAIPQTEMSKSLFAHVSPFSFVSRLFLYLGALACFIFQIRRRDITRSMEVTALFASFTSFMVVLGLAGPAKELMITPFFEIADSLKALHPKAGECIRYAGALSPTLSLALGNELIHNRCEANTMSYLITPEWKLRECENNHMKKVDQKSYLILCVKDTAPNPR